MWKKRRVNYKHDKVSYNHELSSSVLETIQRYTKIRDPFGYSGRPMKSNPLCSFLKKCLKKIRKFITFSPNSYGYYKNIIDYLNDSDTILLGKEIRDGYWDKYDPNNKKEYINKYKSVIGYHEDIKASYRVNDISSTDKEGISIIELEDRFRLPFEVYKGMPISTKAKGIIIAIHGRYSGAEYVMGMVKKSDYNRDCGKKWLQNGHIVYAPQIEPKGIISGYDRLNYSNIGADVARVMDLIRYIDENEDRVLPLIIAGTSYGGHIAEIVGILSDRVDVIMSIGAMARGDFFERLLNGWDTVELNDYPFDSFVSPGFNFYYHGVGTFKLLAPKPLIVSIGTHDFGEEKFKHIFEAVEYYREKGYGKRIGLNVYYGGHEVDADGDYFALQEFETNGTIKTVVSNRLKRET